MKQRFLNCLEQANKMMSSFLLLRTSFTEKETFKNLWIFFQQCINLHPMYSMLYTANLGSCEYLVQMLFWKKMWNPKWRPRNGWDSGLKAKNLITTIQVNLVPNHSETWRGQHKFTWIVVIKFFAFSPLSQPVLGYQFGFHIFFHNSVHSWGPHTFFTAGLFLD